MSENFLISILSAESEKIGIWTEDKDRFDMDLCGWKDSNEGTLQGKRFVAEPASFRIRPDSKIGLKRCASNKSQLSTISSSNGSANDSPRVKTLKDTKRGKKLDAEKRNLQNNFTHEHEKALKGTMEKRPEIAIKKPPMPRRQRKPIKVFKLSTDDRNDE